jgi:hypothetical protein
MNLSIPSRGLACCGLEVTRGVVALGDENVVVLSTLSRLIERNGRTHELLQELASKSVYAVLQLFMVIGIFLGNGGDDSDVIALGGDIVGAADDRDVYVCFHKLLVQKARV